MFTCGKIGVWSELAGGELRGLLSSDVACSAGHPPGRMCRHPPGPRYPAQEQCSAFLIHIH